MRDGISGQYPPADAAARAWHSRQANPDKTWKLCCQLLVVAAAALLGAGHTGAALAQSSESAAPVSTQATPIGCQDRLRLDRRDDPQNAMKNFRQCSIPQEISAKMENLIFWYVTLPLSAPARQDFRFETAWRHNLGILTAQVVGLTPDKATELLDIGIIRGLKRGKRPDLIERWLATHDPAVLATVQSAAVQKASNSGGTPQPNKAAANLPTVPHKTAASIAPVSTAKPHKPRRIERAPQVQRRYARPDPYSAYGFTPSDEMNRAGVSNGWYDPGTTGMSPYPPNSITRLVRSECRRPHWPPLTCQCSSNRLIPRPSLYNSPLPRQPPYRPSTFPWFHR